MRVERSAFHFVYSAVLLLFGLATSVLPQVGVRQSTMSPITAGQRELQAREWALTHIPDEVNKHFKKEQVSLFKEIRENFVRLQVINNEMMQTVFVKKNVDRKLIAKTAAEINKRASRLSEDLVLPRIDIEEKNQKAVDACNTARLERELLTLDSHIMSFINNPLFKEPNVVDAQNALKARSDLNLIIRLSEQLKASFNN
jgi:hypothetical protein